MFCLYLALQTIAFFKNTLFFSIFGSVFKSSHVRAELHTFQHPYFVHIYIAQSQSGSLGRVKPVFWGRIRPTDYMQSKQAASTCKAQGFQKVSGLLWIGTVTWMGSLVFPESAGLVPPSHCTEQHSPWLEFHI